MAYGLSELKPWSWAALGFCAIRSPKSKPKNAPWSWQSSAGKKGNAPAAAAHSPDITPGPHSHCGRTSSFLGDRFAALPFRVCWDSAYFSAGLSAQGMPFLQTEVLSRAPTGRQAVHILHRTSCGHGGKDILRREADVGRQLFKPNSRITDQRQVQTLCRQLWLASQGVQAAQRGLFCFFIGK